MSGNASSRNPPPKQRQDAHGQRQLEAHEKTLAALSAERAAWMKQIDSLKAEKQVLEAVARRLAKTSAQQTQAAT
jgi:cell division protein FtsB